jgi:flagellar biosynthesis protein FlhG
MMDQAGKLREMIQNRIENNSAAFSPAAATATMQKTRFICVTSGKGGVGKTNFSINLGIAMSRLGKNTVVIDADLGLANIDVLAGTVPKFTLNNLLYSNMKLQDILGNGPEGVKIISGGSGIANLIDLPYEQVQMLITHFQELYQIFDVAIIDTGAGLSRNILAFAGASDDIVVVTTPEPTSLTDAYAMIKTITREYQPSKIQIVINRADNSNEGSFYFDRINNASKKFLGYPLDKLGIILEDASVPRAVKLQTPLLVRFPGSTAAKNIEVIALKMLSHAPEMSEQHQPGGFMTRLISLFR